MKNCVATLLTLGSIQYFIGERNGGGLNQFLCLERALFGEGDLQRRGLKREITILPVHVFFRRFWDRVVVLNT